MHKNREEPKQLRVLRVVDVRKEPRPQTPRGLAEMVSTVVVVLVVFVADGVPWSVWHTKEGRRKEEGIRNISVIMFSIVILFSRLVR